MLLYRVRRHRKIKVEIEERETRRRRKDCTRLNDAPRPRRNTHAPRDFYAKWNGKKNETKKGRLNTALAEKKKTPSSSGFLKKVKPRADAPSSTVVVAAWRVWNPRRCSSSSFFLFTIALNK
uniref:Uncharacterized protein n=1 Tax=Rhipicephalus zambeziensis TaxID=60191 RepID=A0A224YFD5_9ACAR